MKSILQDDDEICYICGRNGYSDRLECHHVYIGPNRKISEKNGFKVYLCGIRCHRLGDKSVHLCKTTSELLKRACQKVFEETHTRAEFMKLIGRNYLD